MAQLFHYIKPELLSGVVITHSHPDHASDLPALRHYWRSRRFLGQDLPPLPVWMPQGDKEHERWKQVPELKVQAAGGQADRGELKLEFWAGKHTLPVTMVKAAHGDKSIFYTSDTAYIPAGVNASRGCDLLIAECTLPQEEAGQASRLGHLTWEQCGIWGAKSQVPSLLATHFWPAYDLQMIEKVVAAAYPGRLLMAYPGLVVEV